MDYIYDTELVEIIKNTSDESILSVLEQKINLLVSFGETKSYRTLKRILYDFVTRKHLDGILYILESEFLTDNVIRKIDRYCILLSCKFGFVELLEYLDEMGVDILVKEIYLELIFEDSFKYSRYNHDDEYYDDHFFKSSIHYAVKYKHMNVIKYLSCKKTNADGLLSVCLLNNIQLVKYFLDQQDYDDKIIFQGLRSACHNGNLEMVKYFMQYIPINKRNDRFLLGEVCEEGYMDILVYLIEQEWKIDVELAIKNSVQGGRFEILKYLISKYPDTKYSVTKLITDISYCGQHETLEYLLTIDNCKLKKFIKTNKFNELIETVCERGYFEVFKILFRLNENVDFCEPFSQACENGNLDIVQYIISNKKDFINEDFIKNNQRYITYLMRMTFAKGHLDILKYLDTVGISRSYISEYAASLIVGNGFRGKKLECIKWLFEDTLFHKYSQAIAVKAFRYNSIDIIKYLVSVGLDIKPITNIALDYVSINGGLDCLKYLIENNVDITVNNNRAIKLAAQENYIEIVKCLVENGADIRTDDDYVMKICTIKKYKVLIGYLKSLGIEEPSKESIKLIKPINIIKNPNKLEKNFIKHHCMSIYPDKLMERP
ncbi:putative ankyrin repeat protein [Acanthamoeba polyphaga mimivirus]|uniref:Ankyrin repeat protein n=1 Tax=Acanthamoeba polyphaga mimivirus Kroon TaxID=3069720 RepID=A0A0G2Y9I7_9VIRU|nr:putative ankyrin repeat protein [Acanthamoeba polyphaga mimivirus]AKI79776.1 putative ankyrin repeat protein [Acanthamoeba polyphaga mimivirus Kroon]